ncbi:MAG: pitrilysin family protein [Oscillospiraceae bacterium]
MTREKITSEILKECCDKIVLDNGLTVLVCEMKEKSGVYALYGAKIGSVTSKFILDGHEMTAPAGTAHFLEHKLFENENEDAFELFAKTGASANAFTSFEKTCFVFSTTVNAAKSLEILINFVSSPHFTDKTVQKEQGIIAQEIKMYDDNADWKMLFSMFKCLYSSTPIREDIAGTVESISMITPQVLYDCHRAFYRPENMVLSVAGNISADEVAAVCEKCFAGKKTVRTEVELCTAHEKNEIVSDYFECEMEVSAPFFGMGYKETPVAQSDEQKKCFITDIAFELIAGETSEFYQKLYNDGLVNSSFSTEQFVGEGYFCTVFSGETDYPKEVVKKLKNRIEEVRSKKIDAERFEECKKAFLGETICGFDNARNVASEFAEAHFKNQSGFDIINVLDSIKIEDIENAMQTMFRDERSAVCVINPKKTIGDNE